MNQSESIVGRTSRIVRRIFVPLWLAAFWPFLLEALCIICAAVIFHAQRGSTEGGQFSPMALWQSLTVLAKLRTILIFVVEIFLPRDLATAGIVLVMLSDRGGQALPLKTFVSRMAGILLPLLTLSVVLGLLVMAGGLVFVVPGIFFRIWTAFVMPALAANPTATWSALRKSFGLSLNNFGSLLVLYLATTAATIPAVIALFGSFMFLGSESHWWLGVGTGWTLFTVAMSLVMMVQSVVTTMLYLDARWVSEATPQPLPVTAENLASGEGGSE
jgi:hypothetical protein